MKNAWVEPGVRRVKGVESFGGGGKGGGGGGPREGPGEEAWATGDGGADGCRFLWERGCGLGWWVFGDVRGIEEEGGYGLRRVWEERAVHLHVGWERLTPGWKPFARPIRVGVDSLGYRPIWGSNFLEGIAAGEWCCSG